MKTWFRVLNPNIWALCAALFSGTTACNLVFDLQEGTLATTTDTGTTAGGGGGMSTNTSGGGTGGQSGEVSLSGCVLLLHFDETNWAGQGSIKDVSGEGNDATPMGSAVPTPDGRLGGAALFDGNGFVNVPDAPSLHATTEFTLSVWVQPTNLGSFPSAGILAKREGFASQVAYTLFFEQDNNAFVDIENERFGSTTVFMGDEWWHIAVVYNGMLNPALRARVYVNGVLDVIHTAPAQLALNTQDLRIGDLPGGGNPFVGKIDEVAVWSRALTENEVSLLAEGKIPQ